MTQYHINGVYWYTSVFLGLGRWAHRDFKVILSYIADSRAAWAKEKE